MKNTEPVAHSAGISSERQVLRGAWETSRGQSGPVARGFRGTICEDPYVDASRVPHMLIPEYMQLCNAVVL